MSITKSIRGVLTTVKKEAKDIVGFVKQDVQNASESPTDTFSQEQGLKIKMPGGNGFVDLGHDQIKRVYKDKVGSRLLIVIDESAELLNPSGVKNKEGKEEDQIKQEMAMIIQSLTQLGRSAGVHVVICTQRATVADIGGGNVKNNSLDKNTLVLVQ